MSLNSTPAAERVHIGIFGKRNAGKSSIINALTGQALAVVSDVAGTTTDPVPKAMELLPLGPVMLIDTPGLDDVGELGSLRVQKTYQILNKTDIALLVYDGSVGITEEDIAILERIREKKIPCIVVKNKADLPQAEDTQTEGIEHIISVSAVENMGVHELKELLAKQVPANENNRRIVADLLEPQDFVVLVIPIDSAAPKGRLILPQQQTIRDCLEAGAIPVMCRETELVQTLETLGKRPKLVITDSQIFGTVSKAIPKDLPLTSFSILFARYKGNLESTVAGARALEQLKDGDTVLISEGCTHHRQCEDIGTVKLPRWILQHTGKDVKFTFTSGREFPDDLSPYAMVVHCGGCTLNEREMKYRLSCAADQKIPMTNYGICIAYINGILERSIAPLGI